MKMIAVMRQVSAFARPIGMRRACVVIDSKFFTIMWLVFCPSAMATLLLEATNSHSYLKGFLCNSV